MDEALDRFRRLVVDDPALRGRLLAEPEPVRLAVLVVVSAAAEGLDVSVDTVTAELAAAQARWSSRWL